jgi:hypothetical protein
MAAIATEYISRNQLFATFGATGVRFTLSYRMAAFAAEENARFKFVVAIFASHNVICPGGSTDDKDNQISNIFH